LVVLVLLCLVSAFSACAFVILFITGHRPLRGPSGTRLLVASSASVVQAFSRSAIKAAAEQAERARFYAHLADADPAQVEVGAAQVEVGAAQVEVGAGVDATWAVDGGATTLRAATWERSRSGAAPSKAAAASPAGSPNTGSGGGERPVDESAAELLLANESHLERHDVLAFVDLLKTAPLAAAVTLYTVRPLGCRGERGLLVNLRPFF
jgi:hypothetical protein